MRQPGWLPAHGGTGAIPAGGCAGGPGPCRSLTKQQPGREVNDRRAKGSGRSGPAPYLHPPGSAAPGTAPASCLGQLPPPQLQGHKGRLQGLGAVGRHACRKRVRPRSAARACMPGVVLHRGEGSHKRGIAGPHHPHSPGPPRPPPPKKKAQAPALLAHGLPAGCTPCTHRQALPAGCFWHRSHRGCAWPVPGCRHRDLRKAHGVDGWQAGVGEQQAGQPHMMRASCCSL